MATNNRKTPPKNSKNKNNLPKFNFYWIYGIAIVAIVGFSLMGGSATGKGVIDNYKF